MSVARAGNAARSLATATAGGKVKLPIQLFGLGGRYATALYTAATKQQCLDNVSKEVDAIRALLKDNDKFRDFILDPTLNRSKKQKAVRAIAKDLKYTETTGNFLGVVGENGRLGKLDDILKAFGAIMSAHRGELICEVITAKPLEGNQLKELEGALQKFAKGNQKLQVTAHVDPSIIGGMMVSIGDKYIDMSIARRIREYENALKQAV